ncbi:endonuclease/exonuclease/phosphatase family protein [Sulfitobacter sp. MF3-043]|uniref:endonuclease/exonuclease/phosphatase family protein n=1 Tax=Sulfitobacter sediminivivens TaxID=3252902 RepID=UPI0036DD45F7
MTGRTIIRLLMFGSVIVLIGLVLLGFTGRYFAPGDSVAIIKPQAGTLLIPLAMVLWFLKARRTALISMTLSVFALGSIVPGFFATETDCSRECLTLYQKNLMSKAWPRYSLADDIIASGAQIVTLQEVSDHNRKFMANMFDHFPVAVICEFRRARDVAVLTSLPTIDGTEFCEAKVGLAGVQLRAPNGQSIWIVSVHLEWPFPYGQFRQTQIIEKRIAELEGPVLIAGDFNMVPWGESVQRIRRAVGNHYLGAFRNTHDLGGLFLPLPIDTVLVPKGATGTVELRGFMGSDHRGVLARIALR